MTFRERNFSVELCDNLSVPYKFQVHVVCDLSRKFGTATSVCQSQMREHIRAFFADSLL